jgi:hypothetical protein
MSRKKVMTHEEHLELSRVLSNVVRALEQAQSTVGNRLGFSTRAYKKLHRTLVEYNAARSELDNAYHAVTTDAEFYKEGHVYYGGRNEQ